MADEPTRYPEGTGTLDAAGEQDPRVAELTADLQRLGAEYANYRRRAERDRAAAAEQARADLAAALLPAVDALARAEQHGELTGPLRAVSDALTAALTEAGVQPVGREGEPFDPGVHEAVEHHHTTAMEVTGPVVTRVLRGGHRLQQRVLRPALVAVAEPGPEVVERPASGDDADGREEA